MGSNELNPYDDIELHAGNDAPFGYTVCATFINGTSKYYNNCNFIGYFPSVGYISDRVKIESNVFKKTVEFDTQATKFLYILNADKNETIWSI